MIKKFLPAVLTAGLFGSCLFGQGMNTKASKGDWEEINFEFNSSVLTDGYPSLLRIADLLKGHQDYKVRIVGNTDSIGSTRYNDKLAVSRADTVAQFLQKYGASASQIQASGQGKKDPEVPNRDKLGRWINRRVVLTVMDGSGNVISDGQSMTATINTFEEDINKKLDKLKLLDDIISQLDALKNQVASIKGDTSQIPALVSTSNSIKSDTTNLVARPSPLTYEQTQQIAKSAADYALTQAAIRNKKYSVVGANIGPTFLPGRTGNFAAAGYAKALIPFGNGKTPDQSGTHAVLLGGEYLYYPDRQEGQFDIGIMERFRFVQATFAGSYMRSTFREYQGGASLGAASLILDFPFQGGKFTLFGQKGLKDDTAVSRAIDPIAGLTGLPNAFLKIEDQVGGGATVAIGPGYIEAETAYKKARVGGASSRPTGRLKLVLPVAEMFSITAEASVNETFQNLNDGGRLAFGFQFGNWLKPRSYNDTTAPIPTEVPRIHYELLRANRLTTP
jgi:hypothetical protein